MPEALLLVSEERKIPSCTMNATEDGDKGHQEKGVEPLGISMTGNIERRDVGGVGREGS